MVKEDNYGRDSFELEEVQMPSDDSSFPSSSAASDMGSPFDPLDDEFGEMAAPLLFTPEEERAVVRKLDRRLVLLIAFLYMLSFLDRSSTF